MVSDGRTTPYFKYSVDKNLKMEDSHFHHPDGEVGGFFSHPLSVCIVFPLNKKKKKTGFLHTASTDSFTRFVSPFFSLAASMTAAEQQTVKRG